MNDPLPPYKCVYCGAASWVDPSDQSPPPDYCHESDHGEPYDFDDDDDDDDLQPQLNN